MKYFQRRPLTSWDMILARLVRCHSRRGWLCSTSGLAANQRHHFNIGSGVGGVDRIQGEDLDGTKVTKSQSLNYHGIFSDSMTV